MKRSLGIVLAIVLAAVGVMAATASAAGAAGTPGTRASQAAVQFPLAPLAAATAIAPVLSDTGQISLSVDGLGNDDPAGGAVLVQKPAGGTVRKALLLAASTGFGGYTPVDGDVTVDGNPVTWDPSHTIPNSIGSVNVLADVTSLVKPTIDAAPAGSVSFNVAEPNSPGRIDGEILAVVLNDPTSPTSNSVSLLYGAQNTAGDTFPIGLGTPVNKSDPNLDMTLGLGISFGFQVGSAVNQFSQVSVNSQPLTSAAGGQDDCIQKYQPTPNYAACGNGTLLTVGGVGDSSANPADPNATPQPDCSPRCDDELYDLLPFVNNGDTSISVHTINPSNDDNIFFGSLFFRGIAAIVGEGILLSPPNATNPVGQAHTLTAKAQDANGQPISGTTVTFTATSGPRAGVLGTATTDAGGVATLSYTSTSPGTDTIQASFVDANGATQTSNAATKTWVKISAHGTTATATEGHPFSGTVATFTDPITSDPASTFGATINWGDGTTSTGTISGGSGSFSVAGGHTYLEEGSHTISVTVAQTGNPTNSAVASTPVIIRDAALHAKGVNASSGRTFNGKIATFTDDDPNGTVSDYTASINWGDGHTSSGTIASGFTVNGRHTYAKSGTFKVTVTIRDAGGSTATAQSTVKVSNHAPARRARARLTGVPAACTLSGFRVQVKGNLISSVKFFVGHQQLKSKAVRKGKQYSAIVSLSPGKHQLSVKVTFRKSTHTRARTLHRTVSGCRIVAPKFTG